jgi:hypothetical protein
LTFATPAKKAALARAAEARSAIAAVSRVISFGVRGGECCVPRLSSSEKTGSREQRREEGRARQGRKDGGGARPCGVVWHPGQCLTTRQPVRERLLRAARLPCACAHLSPLCLHLRHHERGSDGIWAAAPPQVSSNNGCPPWEVCGRRVMERGREGEGGTHSQSHVHTQPNIERESSCLAHWRVSVSLSVSVHLSVSLCLSPTHTHTLSLQHTHTHTLTLQHTLGKAARMVGTCAVQYRAHTLPASRRCSSWMRLGRT